MKISMAEATQIHFIARYPKSPTSIELLKQLTPNALLFGVFLIAGGQSGCVEFDETLEFFRKNS